MKHDMDIFDQLDDDAKWAVSKVFLETPEVGDGGEITEALRQRGFVKDEEAN